MLKLISISTIIFIISSGHAKKQADKAFNSPQQTFLQKTNKVDMALNFINDYVKKSNQLAGQFDMVNWVNSNDLTTARFKTELKSIVDDAYVAEPEIGLDFDPILDAQDSPDKGFELESVNEQSNYLIVKGKDWPEFKVTIKIKEENGRWLVDGCGIVNIPDAMRAR